MPTTQDVLDQMEFGYVPEYVSVGSGRHEHLERINPTTFKQWGEILPETVWGEPEPWPVPIFQARTTTGRLVRSDWSTCAFLGRDAGVRTFQVACR